MYCRFSMSRVNALFILILKSSIIHEIADSAELHLVVGYGSLFVAVMYGYQLSVELGCSVCTNYLMHLIYFLLKF
jgi:hypothetical protein